ncbi:hypothetical protein [Dubosiella newyorkensis]|uniref:hypothetical protein n=1 Tax=Dubosiella newyorkensis TaxID=1862672 RepID=UPI00258699A8|nr:hypothetical protein [Dubosiella newyorkensis]
MKRMKKINLQMFADEPQNSNILVFSKEFKELMLAVFGVQAQFNDFFVGGKIDVVDGVRDSATAFSVKTSDIPVTIGTYNKGENVAFGTGTESTSRFGNRTEVIYKDTDVPYTAEWAFHEGVDRSTVNADFEQAIADRLDLQAQAVTEELNGKHAAFISESASKTIEVSSITKDTVAALFSELSKYFTNVKAKGKRIAKVTPDVYNAIVDSGLTTSSKGSTVNIDDNEARKFKGFVITEVAEDYFGENEVVYAYIEGIAKAFTGINTTRTIEAQDFDGVALQGHGKSGEYIPEVNKKAVAKVKLTTTATPASK